MIQAPGVCTIKHYGFLIDGFYVKLKSLSKLVVCERQ
jgi:hypothetical protein